MSLTSVLVIVAVCVVLRCDAWPQIGQTANIDSDCLSKAGSSRKCNRLGGFTCAKLDGKYVTNKTMCDFCKTYGDTEAIVYHEGEKRRCADLEPGVKITVDPECTYMFSNKEKFPCSNVQYKHCANAMDRIPPSSLTVFGENRCEFCKKYGANGDFTFVSFGDECRDWTSMEDA